MDLNGKVAIVTGATGGIGRAAVTHLVEMGANVVIASRDADRVQRTVQEMRDQSGAAVLGVVCDVSQEAEVEAAVQATLDGFGKLDIVVNNAGMMLFKPLEQLTAGDWRQVLDVDLFGVIHFTKQAFLKMSPGGSIVNIASVHAVMTSPLVAPYAAAKAAVVSLTRSAAIEGKSKGIRANAILPGAIDTPMLWENPNIRSGAETIDPSDVGQAEDIAAAVAFLASDAARFITGEALRVDGGRLARL